MGNTHSLIPSIIYADISDHLPILLQTNQPLPLKAEKFTYRRDYSNVNKRAFLDELRQKDWNEHICDCANTVYTEFVTNFSSIYNKSFPMLKTRLRRKNTPRKPWITKGLIKSCAVKGKLYKIFINNPSATNRQKYVNYRNKLNILLDKAEKSYYHNKFETYKSNIKQTWKTIRQLLNTPNNSTLQEYFIIDGVKTSDPSIIAQKFNEYFANIGVSLADKIPSTNINCTSFLKGDFKDTFIIYETTPDEILKVFGSLKMKKVWAVTIFHLISSNCHCHILLNT